MYHIIHNTNQNNKLCIIYLSWFKLCSDIDIVIYGKWKGDSLPLYTMEKALVDNEMAVPNTLQVVPFASVIIFEYLNSYIKISSMYIFYLCLIDTDSETDRQFDQPGY